MTIPNTPTFAAHFNISAGRTSKPRIGANTQRCRNSTSQSEGGVPPQPIWDIPDVSKSPVNTHQPFRGVPPAIICNLQNPWRLSLMNMASTDSWGLPDSPAPRSLGTLDSTDVKTSIESYKIYVTKITEKPLWYKHFHVAVRCTGTPASNSDNDSSSGSTKNQSGNSNRPLEAKTLAYVMRYKATRIVNAGSEWTMESIDQLVYAFVARGVAYPKAGLSGDFEGSDDENEVSLTPFNLALFGREVFGCFLREHGTDVYRRVSQRFSKIVIGTFVACWDQGCPWSINHTTSEVKTYLAASLALCRFVGDCAKYKVLAISDVRACLRLLLGQASSIEHFEGLFYIVKHAGTCVFSPLMTRGSGNIDEVESFWGCNPTRDLRVDVLEFAGRLKAVEGNVPSNKSLLGMGDRVDSGTWVRETMGELSNMLDVGLIKDI